MGFQELGVSTSRVFDVYEVIQYFVVVKIILFEFIEYKVQDYQERVPHSQELAIDRTRHD